MNQKYTNALVNETSPYLLQHAHNPVNWVPWSDTTLERAKKENKPLLISIGYAACHWCHVMEKECFEDSEVAEIMNNYFINVKIDREERPDIDQIYMDALQMMTGSGGWPLNIVALPNGDPFWGTTYLNKNAWIQVLSELHRLYQKDVEKVISYASNLVDGIRSINLIEVPKELHLPNPAELKEKLENWYSYFDLEYGGYKRAPKFMMPTNLEFLLHYGSSFDDKPILDYVHLTLTKMAYGGIYDQLAGGFSRYSVDTKWHIPHFEKMLYDNAQLISLYSKAYAQNKNELYKTVVLETIHFITEELMSPENSFYSSLDADSENEKNELEEGAYYVWSIPELKKELGSRFSLFKSFYNINEYGLWEDGKYVLIRDKSASEFAAEHAISNEELESLISSCKKDLLSLRNQRKKPRLDDKILCSWNALMLKALTDAYRYLGEERCLELALKNANFIANNFLQADGSLFHNHKNGQSTIPGFLEDYAALIDAFIGLYEISLDELWIKRAKRLTDYCITYFFDENSGMFFFTSKSETFVVRRSLEVTDNVIPSSNSIMALNLFKLSRVYPNQNYSLIANNMLKAITAPLMNNISNYANWARLLLFQIKPFYEIALVGEDHKESARQVLKVYLPNTILAATAKESELPLLQNRYQEGKTLAYLCENGSCNLPMEKTMEVLEKLN